MTTPDSFYKQLETKRKAQKITLSEISERTKIREEFLEAIEEGNFPIVPHVYIRLFLRSYAIEIGAEPEKVIEDYEIHTTGTITPKTVTPSSTIEDVEPVDESETNDFTNSDPINRNRIFLFLITVSALFLVFKFVGDLTKEIQTNPETESPKPELKSIVVSEFSDTTILTAAQLPIVDTPILTESVFLASKKILDADDFIKLPITPPYIFTVKAKENTSVHIRTKMNDTTYFDQNLQLPQDSTVTVEFNEKLYFDLWKSNQVEAFINTIQIDGFFNNDNAAVRASIVSNGAFTLSFYNH